MSLAINNDYAAYWYVVGTRPSGEQVVLSSHHTEEDAWSMAWRMARCLEGYRWIEVEKYDNQRLEDLQKEYEQ